MKQTKTRKIVEKLLTVKEALQELRISRATLYRYIEDGLLPSYKLRGTRRFKISDIEKMVRKSFDKK